MDSNGSLRIFDGATAIVTGGASGIGRALAEELAKRGCEVVLADRQIELAEEVAEGIHGAGGRAQAVRTDVTDFPAIEHLVDQTVKRAGRLDYMFNNAGIAVIGDVYHYGIKDWDQIVDVNLRGVINGTQAAYKVMRRQGFGHIVNTASMAGLMPSPGAVAYATTKYAVVGLSKSLRGEAAQSGVRVSVLCPGVVRTAILEGGGKYGRMLVDIPPEKLRGMFERLRPMASDIFAEKALNAVAGNEAIIIVPAWWKAFWWTDRFFPSLGMLLSQWLFQKRQAELGITQRS